MQKLGKLLLIMFLVACEGNLGPDPRKIAEEHNDAKFSDPDKEAIANYFVKLSSFCVEQMTLSQLAQENSINNDIRATGKILESDYRTVFSELRDKSIVMGISIPQEQGKAEKKANTRIRFEIADDFDRLYLENTVQDHRSMTEVKCKLRNKEANDYCESVRRRLLRNMDFVLIKHHDLIHDLN